MALPDHDRKIRITADTVDRVSDAVGPQRDRDAGRRYGCHIQRRDAVLRPLLEDPGWADALIRRYLPADTAVLLPETPFTANERAFVDDRLLGTSADGVYSIRIRDGRT